jgi:plasmid segregation protein ParM
MVTKLGIDIGYSATKAVGISGMVQLPSYEAEPVASKVDDFKDGTKHVVRMTVSGRRVEKLVGDAALRSGAAKGIMGQAEKPDSTHDLLLFTVAYLCGAGSENPADPGEVDVVLGLPIDYLKRQRAALKERLEKESVWISVDGGVERHIICRSVDVRPQGAGIMLASDPSMYLVPDLPVNYVLVLDLGSFTINYLLFEFRNGKKPCLVQGCVGTIEKGVSLVQQKMAEAYQEQTGLPLPAYMMADAWRDKKVFAGGNLIDLSDAIQQATKTVASGIVNQLQSILKERLTYVTSTLVGGGGALLMEDELRDMVVQTNEHARPVLPKLVIAKDPVYANAIGFLNACNQRQA